MYVYVCMVAGHCVCRQQRISQRRWQSSRSDAYKYLRGPDKEFPLVRHAKDEDLQARGVALVGSGGQVEAALAASLALVLQGAASFLGGGGGVLE